MPVAVDVGQHCALNIGRRVDAMHLPLSAARGPGFSYHSTPAMSG